METSSRVGENDPPADPVAGARLKRVMLAGAIFAIYETLFIWLLGDRLYAFPYASAGMLGLVVTAAAGYFALGHFSRSWWSGLFLVLPAVVCLLFVNEVWTVEYGDGGSSILLTTNANFVEVWLSFSTIFVPAWALGVLAAVKRHPGV